MVYTWYIHGILHVYAILIDMSGILPCQELMGLFRTFFIMIYLGYTMNIPKIFIVYPRHIIIKKGTEQTHEVLTRYIPDISIRTAYTCNIPCIYHVYTIYIYYVYIIHMQMLHLIIIYHVYTMYIHIISLYDHLILHEPLHCRVSWHLSAHGTAQSWLGGQQARCS